MRSVNFVHLRTLIELAMDRPNERDKHLANAVNTLSARKRQFAPRWHPWVNTLIDKIRAGEREPGLLSGARDYLHDFAIQMATADDTEAMVTKAHRRVQGAKGGRNRTGIADNDHEQWIDIAKMKRRNNKDLKATDIAKIIAAEPDETRKPDTIARVLRKAGF